MRGRVEGAMSVQLSAVGSQSSGVSTGALGSNTSELSPPPMVSTVPSGSNVRLCSVRAKAIGHVWRQCGLGAVMSSTYVVAKDGAPGKSGTRPLPDFMILQGEYVIVLPETGTDGLSVV